MADKPWLAHYDADVPRSLAAVPRQDASRLPRAAGARPWRRRPALLFKGAACRTRSSTARATPSPRRWPRSASSTGDRVALRAAELPAVLHRGVRRVEGRRDRRVRSIRPTPSASWSRRSRRRGAQTVVTLTPFYERVKASSRGRACAHVIATSIKEYLPPLAARAVHAVQGEEGRPPHHARAGRSRGSRICFDAHRGAAAADGDRRPRRSRGDPGERRHDRHAQRASSACTATTWPPACSCTSGRSPRSSPWTDVDHAAAAAVPRLRQRRRAAAGLRRPEPAVARPEPARHRRSAEDDPAGQAGVLQRRADALQRDPQSSRRARRQGRSQLDQAVLLRRRGADGGNEAAVRGADRRAASSKATR